MKRLKNVDMREYTSFKAGGRAAEMVEPESVEDLMEIMREIAANGKKYIILGNGSNTLVRDEGFNGVVINIGENFGDIGQYLAGLFTIVIGIVEDWLGIEAKMPELRQEQHIRTLGGPPGTTHLLVVRNR